MLFHRGSVVLHPLRRLAVCLLIPVSAFLILFSCSTAGSIQGTEPAAAAASEKKPEASLEEETYQGVSFYAATGDPGAAIAAFEKAKEADPEDPATRVLYSSLLLAVGQFGEAKAECEAVLEIDPENIDALYNLSLANGGLGNEAGRRENLEQIIAIDSMEPRANASLGEMFLKEENFPEAKDHFKRSIDTDPDNFVARIGYGNALRRTEAFKESIVQFDAAAELDPEYSFVYTDRARSKLQLGDPSGAEKDLTKAVETLPDHYWHYIDRGKVRLIDLSRTRDALADFSKAVEINPDLFYAYVYRGGIYIDLARYDEALMDLEFVHKKKPDYYPVYPDLGMLYVLKEQYGKARDYYLKSVKEEPENSGFLLMAGATWFLEEKTAQGVDYFKQIISTFPRDGSAYHVVRTFIEPGYEATALRKVQEESVPLLKNQMLFYLGIFYTTHELDGLAQTLFLEVADANILSLRETRIAREYVSSMGVD